MQIVKSRTSSYTTRNRLGIYYFQYAFPREVIHLHPELPKLFRKTLHTRSAREAEKSARRWWCIMDELTRLLILTNPVVAGKATELLMRYKEIEHHDWQTAENFLLGLDNQDTLILDCAIELDNNKNQTNRLFKNVDLQDTSPLEITVKQLANAVQAMTQNQASPSTNSIIPNIASVNNIILTDLVDNFITFKKDDVTTGTLVSIKSKLLMFLGIATEFSQNKNLLSCELTSEIVRNYRDTLKKIPARRNSFKEGTTFKEMMVAGYPPISNKTFKDTTSLVVQFLIWAENEGYTVSNNLSNIFKSNARKGKNSALIRLNFNETHLIALFESSQYQNGLFKKASEYWVPLIALFTGARLAEILQLVSDDIRQEENIWIFDINEEGDDEKHVKTERSKRLVPIHSTLIKLGFIKFVEHRKKTSSKLFPEETRCDDGKFRNYSKRYATYRKQRNVIKQPGTMLDFHSFRHTIRTKLVDKDVAESLIDDIVGHVTKTASIGKTTYTHTHQLPLRKKTIEKLAYSVDFSKLSKWDTNLFYRTMRNVK